ncbi:MAG: peptidoglycan-binding protein [Propionibacteriaceae bacterium]|jgi:hypothetical protein|nr:peptidoglycan-binding protein [Propionibacteriaceae bacterium]
MRVVVSGRVHAIGDTVSAGDLVAEVSGAPVFAVSEQLPLYRDLTEGVQGNDVVELQKMLSKAGLHSGAADGRLQDRTIGALARMYSRVGYELPELLPGTRGLPLAHTAKLPGDGLSVVSVAQIGEEVTTDRPVMTVPTSPSVVTARVDMVQVDAFTVGADVSVQVGSTEPELSRVLSVSAFREAEPSNPAGYDIAVALPEGVEASVAIDQPVIISETGDIPMGPGVPLSAIRRDASGKTYVLLPSVSIGGTSSPPVSMGVIVTGQAAGYAIIQVIQRCRLER